MLGYPKVLKIVINAYQGLLMGIICSYLNKRNVWNKSISMI